MHLPYLFHAELTRIQRLLYTKSGLQLTFGSREAAYAATRVTGTKLISYPETPAGEFGVNAHHDAGFLTILAPGETPGLEVENAIGKWIPVEPQPETFVINLGEVLQSITGNYFIATPHRVTTRAPRLSAGYFHGPSLETPLTRLPLAPRFAEAVASSPRHLNAGFMAQLDEIAVGVGDMQSAKHPDTYGGQLWNYFARSYPENVARHYGEGAVAADDPFEIT